MKLFTMKDIITDDKNEILRGTADEVSLPLDKETLEQLQGMSAFVMKSQTTEKDENGDLYTSAVGIAAPQLGINKRMFVIAMPDDDNQLTIMAVVNPNIVDRSKKMLWLSEGESCLSVPEKVEGYVMRHRNIRWNGFLIDLQTGEKTKRIYAKQEGYLGLVFQHEYDHLEGVLYTDKLEEKKVD